MKGDLNSMLCDKVLFFLRATENALDDSYMSLALMQPLLEDKRITNPLDQTYAANALNALTWTLFSRAAIDALKATVDGMDGSASLTAAFALLDKHPGVLQELRERRIATPPFSIDVPSLTPDQRKEIESEFRQREVERAEREFETHWSDACRLFNELKADEVVIRLKGARNKLIAHTDTVFEEGKYRARTPADFGLRWSDAAHLTNLAANALTNAMVGLFGIGIAIDEVPGMFGRYADDFWQHLRKGLEVTGGGPDKPVRSPRRV